MAGGPPMELLNRRIITRLDRSIEGVHVDVDDFPHYKLAEGYWCSGHRERLTAPHGAVR